MATNTVIDAINRVASNARVRLAMFMGAQLESGMNPGAVGDNGKSFGIFQIYLVAHPQVTAAQAKDPDWAARFMLPAYEAGVNRVDPALWNSNPAMAAATAAFYAERPKVMYPTSRITASWPTVNAAWTGTGGGNIDTGDGTDSLTSGIPSVGDMWDTIWMGVSQWLYDTFGSFVDYMYFALLFGAGSITAAVGFYLLLKNSSRVVPAATSVLQGYRVVLGRG